MKHAIFYGAGKNAHDHIGQWTAEGIVPLCFADADEGKWHTLFDDEKLTQSCEVLPLAEALERYPDADIYITLAQENLRQVTDDLIAKGLEYKRLKYFLPQEYRLGCDFLGKTYLINDGIQTCCVPGYYHVAVESGTNVEESYKRYQDYFLRDILGGWRKGEPGVCKGCPHLRMDLFEAEPQIEELNISSKRDADYCNAKCIYCCGYPKPPEAAMQKRKEEVIGTLDFFAKQYPGRKFQVAVSGGDVSVQSFRDELFARLFRYNWTACVMTNAAVYCDGISDLLKRGGSNVLVTLDSTMPEIYAKCKGIPALDKVKHNLRRYAQSGETWIKWIVLDGIYQSFDEVKGIPEFAKEIGAGVCVSCNSFTADKRLSKQMRRITFQFIDHALEIDAELRVMYDHFHPEDAQLIKQHVEERI